MGAFFAAALRDLIVDQSAGPKSPGLVKKLGSGVGLGVAARAGCRVAIVVGCVRTAMVGIVGMTAVVVTGCG